MFASRPFSLGPPCRAAHAAAGVRVRLFTLSGNIMKKHFFVLLASMTLAAAAHAQVTVAEPWVRATVPQQSSSGAFMQLRSAADAKLVAASSPAAVSVQMHQMEMQGPMMRMREVDHIDLPAGKTVNLASGGYHIMLVGLKSQLKEGQSVPLTLVLERKGGKRETMLVNAYAGPALH
jgi:copper(I)-binding protein